MGKTLFPSITCKYRFLGIKGYKKVVKSCSQLAIFIGRITESS